MGHSKHIFTWHVHGLPQMCWLQVWHMEKKFFPPTTWQRVFGSLDTSDIYV